jgi:hypothetical protein
VKCDAASSDYVQGTLHLLRNGDMDKIARAFKLQPSEIVRVTLAAGSVASTGPSEGQIALALTNPDGSLSYAYSANGLGFWIAADGSASSWGTAPAYFEYTPETYSLVYGHKHGSSVQGNTYTICPTLVYNCEGKLYKAEVILKMKF